jgi:hypothetical protein
MSAFGLAMRKEIGKTQKEKRNQNTTTKKPCILGAQVSLV